MWWWVVVVVVVVVVGGGWWKPDYSSMNARLGTFPRSPIYHRKIVIDESEIVMYS